MPNYRKKKSQNNRNKNKNKNTNQNNSQSNKSSSSIKKELITVETTSSSGGQPNIPAESSNSHSTASASVLEENVIIVDESSPSSNEEIDENACSIGIDSCISNDKSAEQIQSNYSSPYNCSPSNEITDAKHKSESTVVAGDSLLGNSVNKDTCEVNSGKNNLKTGSIQTKDAALLAAIDPSTTSNQTSFTRTTEKIIDKSAVNIDNNREKYETRSESAESATEVVKNKILSKEFKSSKVIVENISKNDLAEIKTVINPIHTEKLKQNIDQQSQSESISNVIVHPISTGDSSSSCRPEEDMESKSTKVITQHMTKKKAIRSNTSSLQTYRQAVMDQQIMSSSKNQESPSVIIHQINQENQSSGEKNDNPSQFRVSDSLEKTSKEELASKVIFHKVSKEASLKIQEHNVQNAEKSSNQTDHAITGKDANQTYFNKKSNVITPTDNEDNNDQSKRVIQIPILLENSTQTSPLESTEDKNLLEKSFNLSSDATENKREHIDTSQLDEFSSELEFARQTSSSPLSRSPQVMCFTNLTDTYDSQRHSSERTFEPISKCSSSSSETEDGNMSSPTVSVHPILQENSAQTSSQSDSIKKPSTPIWREPLSPLKIPPPRTSFPVSHSPKVIVHQIYCDTSVKPAFPMSARSLEKIDDSSTKIAHKILQDVSSELRSSFERATRNVQEIIIEPVRTSFPVTAKNKGSIQAGFFETNVFETETNPLETASKVIIHPIIKENSSGELNQDNVTLQQNVTKQENSTKELKISKVPQSSSDKSSSSQEMKPNVIVHQINQEESDKANTECKTKLAEADIKPKVLTHKIIQDEKKLSECSTIASLKKGSEKIFKELVSSLSSDSQASQNDLSLKTDVMTKSAEANFKPKVLTHKIVEDENSSKEHSAKTSLKKDSKETLNALVSNHSLDSQSAPSDHSPQTEGRTNSAEADIKPKVITHKIVQDEKSSEEHSTTTSIKKQSDQTLNALVSNHSLDSQSAPSDHSPQTEGRTNSAEADIKPKVITHKIVQDEKNSEEHSTSINKESEEPLKEMVSNLPLSQSSQSYHSSKTEFGTQSADVDIKPKILTHKIVLDEQKSEEHSVTNFLKKETEEICKELVANLPSGIQLSQSDQKVEDTDHQSVVSSSTSEGSIITMIQMESPKSLSRSSTEDFKDDITEKGKPSRKSFFLASAEQTKTEELSNKNPDTTQSQTSKVDDLNQPKNNETYDISQGDIKSQEKSEKVLPQTIIHQVIIEKPLAYRVESPQPDKLPMFAKKSKSFDDDDVVIQEMSDASSAGDTDNPPLVSEAESETDTLEAVDEFSDTQTSSLLLSVQTLPIDHEDNSTGPMSPKTAQDYKVRRQQNRVALESHFLPQFLAPNFLDSIKEETSDISDSERRSECSDQTDHAIHQGDLEDDVFLENGAIAKKANAVFPKSNLDFSKKHKHIPIKFPKTSVIREELSPPSVVEAKIIEQGSVEECCSTWSTDLTPESEAAEVVYIDSASSSVSDLLELDYSQGQPDDSIDVRIQTPTIDLESVNEIFAHQLSESNQRINMPQLPPVKENENINEENLLPPHLTQSTSDRNNKTTKQTSSEQKIPDEIIIEKIETVSERIAGVAAFNDDDDGVAASDRVQNSNVKNLNSCDSAINEVVAETIPSVAVADCIEKMENIREIVCASVQSELPTINDKEFVKPNFIVGQPCSDYTLKLDTTAPTSTSLPSITSTTNTITSESQILTLHDLDKTLNESKFLNPLVSLSSTLDRQESLDSHGSDHSHSTNQSQCTAINQGSLTHCDWNDIDTTTETTYISESDTAAGLASSEFSSPLTTGGNQSGNDTESPPIKKLRSLCTEALASMPYGEEVLQELATVAQTIKDMPYPLPELPQIQDIQLSLGSQLEKSSVINLKQVPPKSAVVETKLKSPPPPPVPEPPKKYDSWLGVPTVNDPSVLVCLSPSQRNAVKNDTTPDGLLDMHKKFVERRGYHEYTTKQVDAINKANSQENQKLNKSNSPPPPLPPRAHRRTPKTNGSEKNTHTNINDDDQNNHPLLAIIRETHESQQQKSSMTSTNENISRRTESEPDAHIKTTEGVPNNFANSPSVSKQTQERFVSESEKSQSENKMNSDRESVMGIKFPTSEYFDSIFDGRNKRFSNIETSSSQGFCSQIQPKRYSNIETSSFESQKCVENGKVLYDICDSKHEKTSEGDKSDFGSFPELKKKINEQNIFPFMSTSSNSRTQTGGDSENIMSAFKLNTQTKTPSTETAPTQRVESSPPAPPVPPLPSKLIDTSATTTTSTSTSESVINRTFNSEKNETIVDEFRHHAREAGTGNQHPTELSSSTTKKSDVFNHSKLFKDFDDLSNLLKDELDNGKRRPPATLNGSEIPASVSDYNRVAKESKIHNSHVTMTETSRKEQMKKLAEEIDQTAKQRQQFRKEMRIPITIERPLMSGPKSAPENSHQPKSYDIPVRGEKGSQSNNRPTLQQQRSYEIPVKLERQRTTSEHQSNRSNYETSIREEKSREQHDRFRRAESMFNISDTSNKHMLHDDWMKYVGDLGSSENICKPFQREVEICYLGRRPNIKAPRIAASTSDLSNIHTYDTHGAYGVKRTTTTQNPRSQQPSNRRYLSTQSLIDTSPITACVSSRRSPIPERRSSLPREIHDQQLKYITSKEHQLQVEFERLENERRQLIDEMNRAQMNQRISREAYRQRQLPPLTEDESFRQQMAEEWLNKVAEREERRLQKIIKISKLNQEAGIPVAPPRRSSAKDDIGDEFLRRVKERRSKLCMPSDSDWESGAESQPIPRTDGYRSETEEPPMTVFDGHSEANIRQLPKHLREFAKLTSQMNEEINENSSCTATKKSSLMTSVKTSNTAQESQSDAARGRDLEQLSQANRQKPVTILRHKKSAEQGSGSGSSQQTAGAVTAGGANTAKRRKQTRFLLTPNRRSWSESDLLREIDKELVLAKGFLYANGVWTPKNQTPTSSRTNLNDFQPQNNSSGSPKFCKDTSTENRSSSACGRNQQGIPTPPPPPLWTPQPERKQFRPVHFESPTLQRKYVRQQSSPTATPAPPPWSYTNSQPFPGYQSQSCTNLSQKETAIPWPPPVTTEPRKTAPLGVDNAVVVEEIDDYGFAPTTSIAEKIRSFERSTSNSELHRPLVRHNPHEKPAIIKPDEVIYSLKNEYISEPESEYDKPKKMAQLSRRQYEGIGPVTKDGMPVVLRSEVKEPNQHEWYKRIFQTIHRQKNPGRYPYKSNGYMSEPERNYDSDYSTVKYRTLERRRLQSTGTGGTETRTGASSRTGNESQDETFYGTMPNPVKSGQGSYKVQPGRIENYITGHSSVSEKEKKEWWDEVMDIFNGQLEQQKLSPHYTEGNLSRALLKEQGYTSDSNLVFRKKDVPQVQSPLSPVEQKQVYKSVQAGGQPPLLGFRKPAPEKPKETEFEYFPITPTLTKIRVHSKEVMSKKPQLAHGAEHELICYPITNISRPIDMFAPFPKHVPSFIPLNQAPLPPNRKSSRTRTTSVVKISSSEIRRPTSANSSRHEACFQTKDAISPPLPKPTKYGTITLRKTVRHTEPLSRSKSAGAVVTVLAAAKEEKFRDGRASRNQQSVRLSSCSPVRSASRLSTLRTSSRSPVAFGRSVSKERSFAEEKKRIEETLPSLRTDFTASTNILRDPSLKSPDQVKRAVRSYAFPMSRSKSAPKVLPPIKPAVSSYMSTYVVRRIPSPTRKDNSKRPQPSIPASRTPAICRSKSQSSKLPEKNTSKSMTKTSSTVSLARTNSTFSVDSTASKVKASLPRKSLTITKAASKTETNKNKQKSITISPSKSDSNVLRKLKDSTDLKKKIIKGIPSHQKAVRTDHFFKNLFMRAQSPTRSTALLHQPSVHEKTRYWNTMSLPPTRTVCDSRHISYRSLSPPAKHPYVEEYELIDHFHSEDETSEFGEHSGRTEDLVWQYEQRSRREPRPARPVSDIARPESPAPVFQREFSPTREIRVPQTREMRSPSRRRIQNFRDSQRGETSKVIRASSLSSADDRSKRGIYHCDDLSHSANSLEYIERHSPSCRLKNSERFIDLNRFYSTLERVGQLERATSATNLKPIRKEGEPMDFEEWRKIRLHERAERELNYLVGKLKEDQKQKDFLFRPKDIEDVKWSGNKDLTLRSKDKSVEDLRDSFEKKIHQEWLDESKKLEIDSKKDTYKPYWRGSSVVDLASNMEIKYNPELGSYGVQKTKSEAGLEKPLCLSNRLISTLSKDQVSKITQQLNEIYNASEPKTKPDVTEEYVITVDKDTPANALKVRCNSSISKDELIGPVLRRKEASEKPAQSKSVDRLSRKFDGELSESEKRRLSASFSREIQGKTRSGSPIILGRETRGAIAAENAMSTLSDIPLPPPLPKDLIETKKSVPQKPKRKLTEEHKNVESVSDRIASKTETTSMETADETISKKIQFFEERKFEEPPKTIYHAREDSSPDEDEIMRIIEENIKARSKSEKFHHQELSSSVADMKDLFGERESSRINFPLPPPPPPPDETIYHEAEQNANESTSLTLFASRNGSLENLDTLFRSRSISPQSTEASYLHRVNTGEVRKIKDKFESLGRPKKKNHFFAISPLRKVRSDPELSNDGSKDTFKTIVGENELGDVSWIAHKFEVKSSSGRGRSRIRKPSSPIQRMPLRKEDRLMPHIDIISKTASLKQEMMKSRSPSPARQQPTLHAGEVERIRCIFETSPDRESPLGHTHLGTSSPELRDISAHLTASWVAHKYPKPLDNDRRSPPPLLPHHEKSISLPLKKARCHERCFRSRSISPPKTTQKQLKNEKVVSILKPRFDFFANQKFDPAIHRPKARYVPDSGDDCTKRAPLNGTKKMTAVKFKDSEEVPSPPPVPPTKGVPLDLNGCYNLESPNRYFESDVNIHYKTPIRYEYKDPIPEEELAIRQAETMQKLYQEERRRKYLQELQDMNSRRHTDNFTQSQKSPIPLNRYDDFNSDLAPKSPNTYPRTVARALYNFQGQTARELTFKKGDVIYIRRQIDKNWYEGEHNAMIGLLPSNYVEILTKDGIRQPPKKPSEGQARAKYNFQAQSGIELSLNKGELVTLTRRVDDNWFEGKIANRKGIFPVSYVEVLVDIGAEDKAARIPASQSIITQSSLSMRPSLDTLRTNINNEFNSLTSNGQPPNGILRETRTLHKTEVLHVDTNTEPVAYRALYKYRPQNTDELELQEGDIVYVLEKCDDGWFVGTSQRTGCFGTFPGNYVERV